MNEPSIKIGFVTDQTGPLSVLRIANADIAKMVVDVINSKGGLPSSRTLGLSIRRNARKA